MEKDAHHKAAVQAAGGIFVLLVVKNFKAETLLSGQPTEVVLLLLWPVAISVIE